MASWPSTLPSEFIEEGYSETPPVNTIRTSMELGPPKVRRRTQTNVRTINGNLKLNATQVSYLDTFYLTTLHGGVDQFDWVHPRTGASVSMRIVSLSYTSLGKGSYNAALSVEIMP